MSRLTLLCGFPASGKSTFLERCGDTTATILCPDDFRKELTGQEFYAPAEEFVWATVKLTARVLLQQGRSVIIDATHLSKSSRSQWIKIAQSLNVPISCWHMNTPFEECLKRNAQRDRKVPLEVMNRMQASFEMPTTEEGFSDVISPSSNSFSSTGLSHIENVLNLIVADQKIPITLASLTSAVCALWKEASTVSLLHQEVLASLESAVLQCRQAGSVTAQQHGFLRFALSRLSFPVLIQTNIETIGDQFAEVGFSALPFAN